MSSVLRFPDPQLDPTELPESRDATLVPEGPFVAPDIDEAAELPEPVSLQATRGEEQPVVERTTTWEAEELPPEEPEDAFDEGTMDQWLGPDDDEDDDVAPAIAYADPQPFRLSPLAIGATAVALILLVGSVLALITATVRAQAPETAPAPVVETAPERPEPVAAPEPEPVVEEAPEEVPTPVRRARPSTPDVPEIEAPVITDSVTVTQVPEPAWEAEPTEVDDKGLKVKIQVPKIFKKNNDEPQDGEAEASGDDGDKKILGIFKKKG